MQIKEVSTPADVRAFLKLPVHLYRNEQNWIRPLDKDIEFVFDKKANKFFRHGQCTRWILQDPLGQTIGRVAAFINNKTAKSTYVVCGGMGFFECTNNQEAAFLLFDTCRKWLEERGMKAMEGPINFGERDKWWGLLVQGFDHEPNYCMPYTLPYYRNFFENYGFREYFRQFTYHRPVETPLPQIYFEKAERIARDPRYRFEHIKKKHLKKYTQDFQLVYNAAWTKHAGVKGISNAQAFNIMQQLKPILDEEIVWFAYHDTLPIGFFIMIPELNQLFKHCNGKFGIWQKLIFLYHKWRGSCTKMYGVAFGIIPQFQGKGLEGAIVQAAANILQKNPKYSDFEMNWIGDFNPKMIKIAEHLDTAITRKLTTYRYLFDRNKIFKKHPTL